MLQSEKPGVGAKFLDPNTIPKGAENVGFNATHRIHPWELETLANQILTVPKTAQFKSRKNRKERSWRSFGNAISCVNTLRSLEDEESWFWKKDGGVLVEMARLASRQFAWQRGYANMAQFYRNVYIYGQGECAKYFKETNGLSINSFNRTGFVLHAAFTGRPILKLDEDWERLGVTQDDVNKTLALICQPFTKAEQKARLNLKVLQPTAYRASEFRKFPCIEFTDSARRIRCPIPELILERTTSGLFYDVADGGGAVRNDYARRFEAYCLEYLTLMLPGLIWCGETKYGTRKAKFDTPDIICKLDGQIKLALECKATRMSQAAMFGRKPTDERGFEDMAKAVFQLWRYFSHCRRGLTGHDLSPGALGVILTLDNWLAMSGPLRDHVLAEAGKMADAKDALIIDEDRRPVVFVAIDQLERTLATADEDAFLAAVAEGANECIGWMLDGVHKRLMGDDMPRGEKYPFAHRLGEVLPWWDDHHSRAE
ncbi:hypothetical protein SAMN05444273_11132 [Litoreibacter ascidiaceicola]|uniref:Uncharacterized protein n=2 Tax=Litoreibacter ascidiaceicola TaxID=1486859 RepID=A0A1M5E5N6_9RHOB|nr:hypothetical protein SAMN05444273_11132 [Litoreibacter ascidiaceicola]